MYATSAFLLIFCVYHRLNSFLFVPFPSLVPSANCRIILLGCFYCKYKSQQTQLEINEKGNSGSPAQSNHAVLMEQFDIARMTIMTLRVGRLDSDKIQYTPKQL